MKLKTKDILTYTFMPQIAPRLRNLFGSGFSLVAHFIALVFAAVNLLPPNHPYTHSKNISHFGIRHVIAEAANGLKFDLKHIDQILLFATILIGLATIAVQIVLLVGALFIAPVMAQVTMPNSFAGFFTTPNASQDLAFMMMDMVFGVPDMFNSCVTGV